MSVDKPPVSIIMPCYNSVETLTAALEGILALDYPVYEVIVVDDCSTDGSYEILREFAAASQVLRPFRLGKNSGVQAARDFATRQARYDWIASTDSDAVVPPSWLTDAAEHFGEADMIGGKFVAEPKSMIEAALDKFSLGKSLSTTFYTRRTTRLDPYVVGNNFFYRKSVFDAVGGYDQDVRAAEELLLVAKGIEAGFTYVFDPQLVVRHPFTPQCLTFREFLARNWQAHKWRKFVGGRSKLVRNRNRLIVSGAAVILTGFAGCAVFLGIAGIPAFAGVLLFLLALQAFSHGVKTGTKFSLAFMGAVLKFVRRLVGGVAILLPGGPTSAGWSKRAR